MAWRGISAHILRRVKLIVAIVHNEDAGVLVDALLEREYRATRLHSSGGFLKQSNATILVGVEEAQVEDVIATIRETCHARTQHISPMPPIMEPGEFYMPYPVEVGLARSGWRAEARWDRFEADATDFHVRVREAYLRLAAAEPRRFAVIAADRGEAEVANDIRREVDTLLGAPA